MRLVRSTTSPAPLRSMLLGAACVDRSEVSMTRSIASTVTGASSVPSLSV